MLYFFHHYELPVILQQAQLQQLLWRTHARGMAGMMGLAGIAAMASGAAYHDAPSTAIQATPPTTQSTTQTVQNTAQSTTQTTPSVSTVQTNTTQTGDMSNNSTENGASEIGNTNRALDNSNTDTTSVGVIYNTPNGDRTLKIEEIARKNGDTDKAISNSNPGNAIPSGTTNRGNVTSNVETTILDLRRKDNTNNTEPPPLMTDPQVFRERVAPFREADDLD